MSDQLAIDFQPQHACRASDPVTSVTAAERAGRFAGGHAGRILAALKTHGPQSAHEIGLLIGLTVVQIDRRTCELQRARLIAVAQHDDGADVVRHGCRVWKAV